MGLERNQHQGLLGESFIRVIASAAGLVVAKNELDTLGEDFTIGYKGTHGSTRYPKIDVQVKSWSRRRAVWRSGFWRFPLRAHNFNDLAGPGFSLPRFLFIVIVPDQPDEYVTASPDAVHIRHAAYWLSLRDHQPVDLAANATVQVNVPQDNLLTVNAIRGLMLPGGRQSHKEA